ncbi:glycosyltransferase family 4 protein [bacterium]|nr:glycosyltransferase family 4 protein [bacterium]
MKIAVNTRLLVPKKMDGIGWFTYETLQRLTKQHPEHEFHFIFDRAIDPQFIFGKNVIGHTLSPQARHPYLWVYWFEFALKRKVKKIGAQLLISPEGWLPPLKSIPMLGVIHDLNFEHFPENIIPIQRNYLLKYFPKFAERASRIATVSEFSKQDIVKQYHIQESKIDVVFNGANKAFQPLSVQEKKQAEEKFSEQCPYFLFIGTLHPRKNLENLFLAFESFKHQTSHNHKLVIGGNRKWWPKQLEATYQSLEFKKDILFLGRVKTKDLPRLVGGAFCLSYVPQFEGFGIPIIEAMQSGVPVITSNTSSMPEVANNAALLADPFSSESIAKQMINLSNSNSLRRELIEKGYNRAKDFSWDKTAQLLWESIEKTLKQWP